MSNPKQTEKLLAKAKEAAAVKAEKKAEADMVLDEYKDEKTVNKEKKAAKEKEKVEKAAKKAAKKEDAIAEENVLPTLTDHSSRRWLLLGLLLVILVIFLSVVAISIATTILQYGYYDQRYTNGLDDVITRHTFAFILSGPLTPLSMFFIGAVGAFSVFTILQYKTIALSLFHAVVLVLLGLFAFGHQIWSVVLMHDLDKTADEANSDRDDPLAPLSSEQLKYPIGFFTSPLFHYVLGTNYYLIFAIFVLVITVIVLYLKLVKPQGGEAVSPNHKPGLVEKISLWTAIFLLCAACLLHTLFSLLVVYTSALDSEQKYWVAFADAAISYNFAFILSGWIAYAWLSGMFSAHALVFKIFTMIVAIIVVFLFIIQLFIPLGGDGSVVDTCGDTIFEGGGHPEIAVFFCTRDQEEREEHRSIWTWYVVNTCIFFAAAIAATVAACASLVCTVKRGWEPSSAPFKARSSDNENEQSFLMQQNLRGAYFADDY
jgi:hypothetical protein